MCVCARDSRAVPSFVRSSVSLARGRRARARGVERPVAFSAFVGDARSIRGSVVSSSRAIRFDSIHPFDRRMIRRPRLVDIDWRVGVTASTSETNASGASRVSVRLTLEEDADDGADDGDDAAAGVETSGVIAPPRPRRRARRRRFERVEMSVTQFYALARELDKASAALDAHAGARRG